MLWGFAVHDTAGKSSDEAIGTWWQGRDLTRVCAPDSQDMYLLSNPQSCFLKVPRIQWLSVCERIGCHASCVRNAVDVDASA